MTADEDRVTLLAAAAVRSVIRGDNDRAVKAIKAIDDAGEVGFALAAWCDWLIVQQEKLGMATADSNAGVVWRNTASGQVDTDAADVPAEVGWAGRLIQARAALDRDAFGALLNEVPKDPRRAGAYVWTLLSC